MCDDKRDCLTLETVYKRLRECLEAVKPNDKKLSPVMRQKLDYNIQFLRCYIDLQADDANDIQAIGFKYDEDCSEDEEQEAD